MRAHLCKRCYNHIVTMTERQRDRSFSVTHLQYIHTQHHGSVFTFLTLLRREREECRSSHQISFSVSDALHHSDMFTHDIGHQLRPYFTMRNTSGTRWRFQSEKWGQFWAAAFLYMLGSPADEEIFRATTLQPPSCLWPCCIITMTLTHLFSIFNSSFSIVLGPVYTTSLR